MPLRPGVVWCGPSSPATRRRPPGLRLHESVVALLLHGIAGRLALMSHDTPVASWEPPPDPVMTDPISQNTSRPFSASDVVTASDV